VESSVRVVVHSRSPHVSCHAAGAASAPGGWLGILADAAVFVAALAVPLDDPALLLALVLALRGGRVGSRHGGSNRGKLPAEPPGGSIMSTILVVDDRPDARYSMARPLAAAGFDVRETATGREALRLARLPADVIVLDLVLPDLDGYEVLRGLKADPATMNIPVILKTAVHDDDGHRQVALDAGAVAYFAEPFDTQGLVAVVRQVLGDGAAPGM